MIRVDYYDLEYKLDSMDSDCEYVEKIPTMKAALRMASHTKKRYGTRLVLLDIKGFKDGVLERHIDII